MKKIIALILTLSLLLTALAGCGGKTDGRDDPDREQTRAPEETDREKEDKGPEEMEPEDSEPEGEHVPIVIMPSPDKYTWYIKDYVGKNAASFGYTSFSEERMDRYGSAVIELVFVTEDGRYIDITDEDLLKKYVVTAQNIAPNTELKISFMKDSEGNEFDYLTSHQSIEKIVLAVKETSDRGKGIQSLTAIDPSPDKYTWYINDYVGRNLMACGYVSFDGALRDSYGNSNVQLIINATNGSFVDPEDTQALKNYVVISQDVPPNTELKLEFMKASDGTEYENLIASKNIEEISLVVAPIGDVN